jgi:rod shape-determining protein MreD
MSPLLLLPLVYLAAALQTILSPGWQVAGVVPDLIALTAFTWLAVSKNRYGFVLVALLGLVADLGSPVPLGLGMATFALVGYLLLRLRLRVHLDHLSGQIATVALATASICFVQSVALRILRETSLPWLLLLPRCILVGLYTAGLSVPVLMLIGWLQAPRSTMELSTTPLSGRG